MCSAKQGAENYSELKIEKIHAIFCLLISDQKLCAKTENNRRLIATINRIRRVCSSKIVRLATMIESQNTFQET